MTNYFNTTLGLSMLPDGDVSVKTLSEAKTKEFLSREVENIANPNHANTLDAVSRRLGIDVRGAKGGRVTLASTDFCLVAEIGNVPRETREFTDEEIDKAIFKFRLVEVK